ncbi:uncharacterized protein Tco025E_02281 [Trypanosoma conorhini]|uniref:C3H1-type domain-containing protein n=1 Tax=Trypanosoma conorhini TaxID=83891 RepID=A0A3R7NX25_9TRYP|nr:uncharacterized protein Tco025E_02281 [Trypanosoma conorhini]RNF25133.1 hypothetical protein Tco025E_02281 [Trypanosoma conorhini]
MQKTTAVVDFEAFLRASFPSHGNVFTTEDAVRALAGYTGASHWDASLVVDLRQLHHTLEQMQTYAARMLMEKREITEEGSRMTVMLPTTQDVFESDEVTWKSRHSSSPLPAKPCAEERKKICKQFRETGACKFGSRCLYHHSVPLNGNVSEPNVPKASVGYSLGIMNRCVEELQGLKLSDEASNSHSKGGKRAVLAALPSSTNNYSASPPMLSNAAPKVATETPQDPPKPLDSAACPTFTAMGSVVMVPLSLPNGIIYGYAPLPLQMPLVQYTPQ